MLVRHIPVLLGETIAALRLSPDSNVVDGTLGDGGHTEKILEATGPHGKLLGLDADVESLLRAKSFLYRFAGRAEFVHANFAQLQAIVTARHFQPVHGVLLDLGWSSPQFAERGRGFSFETDEPLDMRYGQSPVEGGQTAAEILNTFSPTELSGIFRRYGEEKLHREIAAAIVAARKTSAFQTTKQLVTVILETYRHKLKSTKEVPWVGGLHPATKVFQALRLEVNHELQALESVLPQALQILAPGGRLAVITFHSLEDRIVKQFFQTKDNKTLRLVYKKPVIAGADELKSNPRARSAKLRVAEKI